MSATDVALDPVGQPLASAEACLAPPTPAVATGAGWRPALKRAFDVTGSILALVVLAPLFLIVAVAIKLTDPGPVFYRHRRVTLGGQPLEILKFRTMHARYSTGEKFGGRTDADVFTELGRPELSEEFRDRHKLRRDPRISRVGGWLRRTSLDELPQLWNILRGELSAVGPRPIVIAELEWYRDADNELLSLKPGLTGLWQVSGRCDLPYRDRVKLDLDYAENWSLGLDLKILCLTVPAVLSGRGAY